MALGLCFRIIVILYGIAGGLLETGQQCRRERAARPRGGNKQSQLTLDIF